MGRRGLLPLALVVAEALVAVTLLSASDARAASPHGFYGVGLARNASERDLGRMAKGGVTSVRLGVDWRAVQPSESSGFQWAQIDNSVRGLVTHHIGVLPELISTPGWLASSNLTAPVHSKKQRAAWRKLLTAAVDRYGRHGSFWSENASLPYTPVTHWQIWNEQNSPGFFEPKPSPRAYAKLLKISAKAIRQADPRAKIVLGGMFETTGKQGAIFPWKFLGHLYKLGARRYFDVVGSHPYYPQLSGVKFQVERLRDAIRRHHDRQTPIWVDEIGWGSDKGGSLLNEGRRGQARLLKKPFRFLESNRRSLNVQRVFWYPFRDGPYRSDVCGFCNSEGLLNRHGKAKPAWRAYRRFATR